MMRAAKQRGIPNVMMNTNGKRIARDDGSWLSLPRSGRTSIFSSMALTRTPTRIIRGEPDILPEKLRALDRLAEIGCTVTLVPAIERGVNEHEIGRIIRFGIDHPAVKGHKLPARLPRRPPHCARPDAANDQSRTFFKLIEEQTDGVFLKSDFVPVPCCFPTCNSVTYAYIDENETVTPLPRILNVDDYLDYITNRVMPDFGAEIRRALEGLWSSSAVLGLAEGRAMSLRFPARPADFRTADWT